MKGFLSICCFLLFIGCKIDKRENFEWLTGKWILINAKEDEITREIWTKRTATNYEGIGFTLLGKDTIFKEDLQLNKKDGSWNLIVTGVNEEPTVFPVISYKVDQFLAENPKNEFPKRISYFSENGKLYAIISADENRMKFEFERED